MGYMVGSQGDMEPCCDRGVKGGAKQTEHGIEKVMLSVYYWSSYSKNQGICALYFCAELAVCAAINVERSLK